MGSRLRALWNGWLRFARALGTINTFLILSVIYWVFVVPIGLTLRLLGKEPLGLRRGSEATRWQPKRPVRLDALDRQF